MGSSIFRPCCLVVPGINRSFLSIAYRLEDFGIYAETDKVILRGVGSFLTKHEVILYGTPLIAVTFDFCFLTRICFEPRCIFLQYGCVTRSDIVLIKIKIYILHHYRLGRRRGLNGRFHFLLRCNCLRRRGRRRRLLTFLCLHETATSGQEHAYNKS